MPPRARSAAPAQEMFRNGDTVVWRSLVTLRVFNARLETSNQMGEGPFGLSNLNLPKVTCTLTLRNGRYRNDVPLAWIEGDGSDEA